MKKFKGIVIPEKKNVSGEDGCNLEKINEQKHLLETFMVKQKEIY